MGNERNPRQLITKIWAKGFRSLKSVEVELSPLTVLVGPNSSGKSNLLDILGFVTDAVWYDLETAITERGGITSIGHRTRGRRYDPEIGLRFEDDQSVIDYGFAIRQGSGGEYQLKREYARVEHKELPGEPFEIEVRNGHLAKPNPRRLKATNRPLGQLPEWSMLALNPQQILDPLQFDLKNLSLPFERALLVTFALGISHREPPYSSLLSLHRHLRDMRFYQLFPNVLRGPQKLDEPYPLDEEGENLASALRNMIHGNNRFLPDLNAALSYAVPGVRRVTTTQAGGYLVVKLEHANERGSTWFDLSQESDGTLRLLGLLVALYQDPPLPLIAIEEPELNIHPGALAILADVIKEAASRTQVLVTTHSPDLIDRLPIESIRAVIAEGGETNVGEVAEYQRQSVRDGLFLPGELHRMEGLQIAGKEF